MSLRKIISAINIGNLLLGFLFIIFMFMVLDIGLSIVPWYQMRSIEIIYPEGEKAYSPGDIMIIVITREALIPFEAHLTRELIKVNESWDEMIWWTHEIYGVEKGLRKSTMYLQIPTLAMAPAMTGNSYIWKGTMVYKPFGGPERTLSFKSKKFHIEVKDPI